VNCEDPVKLSTHQSNCDQDPSSLATAQKKITAAISDDTPLLRQFRECSLEDPVMNLRSTLLSAIAIDNRDWYT
jgi:hypothetical protein